MSPRISNEGTKMPYYSPVFGGEIYLQKIGFYHVVSDGNQLVTSFAVLGKIICQGF